MWILPRICAKYLKRGVEKLGVTEDLYSFGMELAAGVRVRDVRIGLGYTAARVDTGDVGLAYTFRLEAGHSCTAMEKAGELAGSEAEELLGFMREGDAISSAVGLATLNALLQRRIPRGSGGDFLDLVALRTGEAVGMVGFFGPVIPVIKKAGCDLSIFEKNLERGKGLYPPSEIPERLPHCSVVILSATTLINHTFDGIIAHAKMARAVVMLGPSTPLVPEVIGKYGVTLLAGMRVVDPQRVLQIVSEAGGTRKLGRAVKKVVVSCEDSG